MHLPCLFSVCLPVYLSIDSGACALESLYQNFPTSFAKLPGPLASPWLLDAAELLGLSAPWPRGIGGGLFSLIVPGFLKPQTKNESALSSSESAAFFHCHIQA